MQNSVLIDGLLTVDEGCYQWCDFTVPHGAKDICVEGVFRAAGGSGNDILVLVMDKIAFINWENHHDVEVYYSSKQITADKFKVNLPSSGIYCLVFSNHFSFAAKKQVSVFAKVSYM